ncbi:LA_3751/LA_3752 family putative glycosyltransferase [Leptospira neocaledonica]|uniref:Glycosyltransferase RgtA/B/C/D-like domain-containing protein n=1 Tax=Leptospira neocaledonica TaxID=2023192 RepID=A0A2M9ZUL3_9LEPT|nr:hypothetical protein [Leptospira neocaledonica]PJZ75762.1 hypothetical protein CH365_17295 [Leptospira neocaledonica]
MFKNFILKRGYWIVPLAFVLYFFISIPTNDGFNSDSGLKLLQARGLLASSFRDQEVFYPGKQWDPEYRSHLNRMFLVRKPEGGYWGQYSVLFAAISAPILFLFGTSSLVPFCILLYLASIVIFQIIYKPTRFTVFFALLCTPIILYSMEYSENTLFLLFASAGLSFYFRDPDLRWNFRERFLGGILLGMTVWFRLEPFIFIPVLGLSIAIVEYKKILNKDFWKGNGIFAIGIAIPIIIFLIFNEIAYGNLFGPRFVVSGKTYWDVIVKLKQLFVLFFLGYWKLGFFGYMPILLWVFFDLLFSKYTLSIRERVLILTILIFVPTLSFSVNTEAFVSWGPRYLSLAIFPGLFLLDSWYRRKFENTNQKLNIAILLVLITVSLWATFRGLQMIRASYKQIKNLSEEFTQLKPDFLITSSYIIGGHFGRLSLSTPCFFVNTLDEAESLSERLFKSGKEKRIVYLVTKYQTEDIERKMEGGQISSFSQRLKDITPHIISYRDFGKTNTEEFLKYLTNSTTFVESKETHYYTAYIFSTKSTDEKSR